MKCSETYKKWVGYLKRNGLYSEYLYTMGKVSDHNFFCIFSSDRRPKPGKTFVVSANDIKFSSFWLPNSLKDINRPALMRIMKHVDNRVGSLNNVYRYQEGIEKVFTKHIVWTEIVRDFYIDELRQKYGEEALERMYKRREIRREQHRKAEEERRRILWGDLEPPIWFNDALCRVETATTYTGTQRRRSREEGGQWYDRVNRNRNNIRRQDRWRFRR